MIDLDTAASVSDPRAKGLDEEAATHEMIDEICVALRSMPRAQREAFCRRHLQGLSPEEIQRRVGVNRRTYRRLIQLANDKVRTRLEASEAA